MTWAPPLPVLLGFDSPSVVLSGGRGARPCEEKDVRWLLGHCYEEVL